MRVNVYVLDEFVPKGDIAEWVGKFLLDFGILMRKADHDHLAELIESESDPIKRATAIRQWYNSVIDSRL